MKRFARLRRPLARLRAPRWLMVVLGVVVLLVGGSAAAAYGYDRATDDRILPGVEIAGIDVSGMTRAQAVHAVQERLSRPEHRMITIRAGHHTWTRSYGSLGVHVDPVQAVDQAFDVSNDLPWMSRVYHRITHHSVHREIPIPLDYDRARITGFVNQIAVPQVSVKPRNAAFRLDGEDLVIQHARAGAELKPLVSSRLIYSSMKSWKRSVDLPVLRTEPKVTEDTMGKTITVDVSTNTLRLYDGMDLERTYPVATAMYGFTTPIGEWEVINKVEDPTWVNPCPDGGCWAADEPPTIGPGPGNPLGTRALYLDAPGIRIHGTPSDSSIGTYASHGCIRMHISDSEALYPLVPVGTKVIIYGAPPWGNISFSGVTGV